MPFPVVMTGPAGSKNYFRQIDDFIRLTLGSEVCSRYQIIIDDPTLVAKTIHQGLKKVRSYRTQMNDAFHFNWRLRIDEELQSPFVPSHENMRQQKIDPGLPVHQLASQFTEGFLGNRCRQHQAGWHRTCPEARQLPHYTEAGRSWSPSIACWKALLKKGA